MADKNITAHLESIADTKIHGVARALVAQCNENETSIAELNSELINLKTEMVTANDQIVALQDQIVALQQQVNDLTMMVLNPQ